MFGRSSFGLACFLHFAMAASSSSGPAPSSSSGPAPSTSSGSPAGELLVPAQILHAIRDHVVKQPCALFLQRKCRKGKSCKFAHGARDDTRPEARIPYISRYRSPDGLEAMTLRPPLKEALTAYCRCNGAAVVATTVRQVVLDGQNVVVIGLSGMTEPDKTIIGDCRTACGVTLRGDDGKYVGWKGVSTSRKPRLDLPAIVGHGTNITSGLQVLLDRSLRTGDGIAGHGVYCFADDDAVASDVADALQRNVSDETTARLWQRTRTGGYPHSFVIFVLCFCSLRQSLGWCASLPTCSGIVVSKCCSPALILRKPGFC